MTEDDIVKICYLYNIKNYTINDDMSIDVNGNVNLFGKNLTEIPLNFNKVSGKFFCDDNAITSLKGCPKYIGNYFDCSSNQLSNLKFFPTYIGSYFNCTNNKIITFDDLPVNFHIDDDFYSDSRITDPKAYSKLLFGYIGGKIYTNNQRLDVFLNENKNPPKKDLPRLLSELRKLT